MLDGKNVNKPENRQLLRRFSTRIFFGDSFIGNLALESKGALYKGINCRVSVFCIPKGSETRKSANK